MTPMNTDSLRRRVMNTSPFVLAEISVDKRFKIARRCKPSKLQALCSMLAQPSRSKTQGKPLLPHRPSTPLSVVGVHC